MSDVHISTVRALVGELAQLEHLITHTRRYPPGGGVLPLSVQLRAQLARRRQIIGELRLRRALTRPWPGLLTSASREAAASQRDDVPRGTAPAASDGPRRGTAHRTASR